MKLPQLNKTEIRILLAVFIAIGFLIWVYFYWLVWEEKEINLGPTKEARTDKYFAAQKFLNGRGVDTHLSYSPTAFEEMRIEEMNIGEHDAIILSHGRGVINGQRFVKLWSWIEAGGTLIMSTENPFFNKAHQEDELYDKLGLSGYQWQDDDYWDEYDEDEGEESADEASSDLSPDEVEAEQKPEQSDEQKLISEDEKNREQEKEDLSYLEWQVSHCETSNPVAIEFKDEPRPIMVFFDGTNYFYADGMSPETTATRDDEYVFASYKVGKGKIFVNASNYIWQNADIACFDHAYFLKKAVGESPKVWFVVNKESPSLFNLIWKGIPIAVVACFAALVLSLWRALLRFGPVFPDQKIERRSFAEHIRAGADFLWRKGLQAELIEQLRKDITQRMGRRNPGFEKMTDVDKLHLLQRYFGMGVEDLELVYFTPLGDENKKDFVVIVSKLKTMKEQL